MRSRNGLIWISQSMIKRFLEHTPEDFNILDRKDYRVGDERVLLVIPCSQTKPYSNSRTHRVVADATAEWNDQIHKVTVSGMYGPVPEQYENLSQIKSYEYVLTNAEKQRQQVVVDRLVSYLEEYGSQFDAIVGYATSKTYRTVIEQAFSEYEDGVVLQKTRECTHSPNTSEQLISKSCPST